jgi:adenylate cyclase class 2
MKKEIEAKFLQQNHQKIRAQLTALNATLVHPMTLMRRMVFDFPDRRLKAERAWVRLREELDGSIELMIKKVKSDLLGETYEQAVLVSDYEAAQKFVLSLGLVVKGEQESKREVWRINDTEIMLDEWPWVPPFVEIEASSEQAVRNVANKLQLNWDEAKFGGVTPVYLEEYDLTREEFEGLEFSMKFDQPMPECLSKRRKGRR